MKLKAVTFQGLTYHVGKNMSTHFEGESVVTGMSLSEGVFVVDFENGARLVLNGTGIAIVAAEAETVTTPPTPAQAPVMPRPPEAAKAKKMSVAERMAKARAARQTKAAASAKAMTAPASA